MKVVIEVKVPIPLSERPEVDGGDEEGDEEGDDEGDDERQRRVAERGFQCGRASPAARLCFIRRSSSTMSITAPSVIALSATLNDGKYHPE